uniref:Glutathione S-transferase omega n=1 Tax=Pavo cristatus TaxID=9049 RepID=A0A8C9FSP6_PAVCR
MTGRAAAHRLLLFFTSLINKSLLAPFFSGEKKYFIAVFLSVKWLILGRTSGKMRGSRRMRVQLLKHEVVNINLKNKPDWIFEKNPDGLVPILETSKGQLIYESPITCEYLDEAFPGRKLMPSDPYERAFQKMLLEHFSKITTVISKALKEGRDLTTLKTDLAEKFGKLDEILSQRNTVFYGGDSTSLIDYMIWPWFERLEAFQLEGVLTHTPKLQRWMEAMRKDPAVKDTITDSQTFRIFLQLYYKNSPEACDYGL